MKTPLPAPHVDALIARTPPTRLTEILVAGVDPTVRGRYRHWDSLRHLTPPDGWSVEEWWLAIRIARKQISQDLPVTDSEGRPFTLALVGPALEMLHRVDQQAGGRIAMPEVVTTQASSRRYVVASLIEEAITSSQLEGASTTRGVAKEMLRTGRPPATRSERMIVNNHRAMQFVSDHRGDDLTPALVLELHRIVTEGTLDDPDAAGRLQRPDEERVVVEDDTGGLLHRPPPASQLPERLERLCSFANETDTPGVFVHPVVRAIAIHFRLAYDHPFEDGNGRTARALFYWAMLHHGYWLAEYLSISRILTTARAKYARAFLYSEQDDNDLTYFVLYQLAVVCRAIDHMHGWLGSKAREVRDTESLLRSWQLNHRQSALLGHALRNPGASYTHRSHATSHGVVIQSARNDLMDLVQRGLLTRTRMGRQHVYWPVRDLVAQVRRLDG